MNQADIEHAVHQTHRLEQIGIVQADPELDSRVLGTASKVGRPRIYKTEADRKKAYRERLANKPLAEIRASRKQVTDIEKGQNTQAVTL